MTFFLFEGLFWVKRRSWRVALVAAFIAALGPDLKADVYPRIEASFTISSLATDPFDYTVTDVKVQLQQPDSTTITLPAFFDGGSTWRVRHTPFLPGNYQVTAITLNGSPATFSNLQPGSWNVGGKTSSSGYVRVDPANSNSFILSNGRRYFPQGQNLAWDTSSTITVAGTLPKLGGARENWARIWMDHWDGKNLEWPKVGAFGQLSLPVAQKWDAIISAAEQAGVYVQMTLQHHGQYSTTVDGNWNQNPFNTITGGFMTNAAQFFTNATAKALTKKKYRYIVARWGYSPAIMAWELFNEVQFTDAAQGGQWAIVGAWHDEMAQFIRSQDPYQHLITTSSDVSQPIWSQCDYYQHHDYPNEYISALRDPVAAPAGPTRPIFGGEAGSDLTPFYGLGAPLWAGLMNGQPGCEPWYWDRIEAESGYPLLRSLRDFTLYAGIAEQNGLVKSAPHVSCPQNTALVFSPGGGWAFSTQDTFMVGDVAPDGIGTLPSFLQGTYHRTMTPNGYTFNATFPAGGGTFSAQVLTIASSGAGLRLTVDNTTTNIINFPAAPTDQNTNFILSIPVPAGAHTIRLWNPGLDWVNLGNLSFDPYVPMLGAYQIGSSNFTALWLWHRTNIYNSTASATLGGTVPVSGLAAGDYNATWWDTFAGVAVSNFNFTASGAVASLPIPPVLRSIALFIGKTPHAAVSAPVLVQTMGSNSPPITFPLTITNGGGLPMTWSLSFTGLSAVSYTSSDSRQPGGPRLAWKDISGIGRDLTGGFSSLTGKTAHDEGIAGPIDIGFAFPFFSGAQTPASFTQLYVSPNGFVSFSPFTGDTSTNTSLPSAQAPTNLIACLWDDLDLGTTGKVYCATDSMNGEFTVQWHNVRYKGSATNCLFQLTLKTTGEILMQYFALPISNACTVGLQNGAANKGLQVAFNQNYVQSNLCVRLTPCRWLTPQNNRALLPRQAADAINITLDPTGLTYGTYTATIVAQTSDPTLSPMAIPVSLEVSPIATWRQAHFGTASNSGIAADGADPDADGVKNIFEYAFNTDPNVPNISPVSVTVVAGHLTLTFKRTHPAPPDITYLFEVSDGLSPAAWQTGAAFTTQVVSDNLNGTETVTVTDNLPIAGSTAHFLRVSISRP